MKRAKTSVREMRRAAVLVAAAGLTSGVQAQVTWTGGAGTSDWHTNANWSSGQVPPVEAWVNIPPGFIHGVSALGVFVSLLTAESTLSVGGGGTSVVTDAVLKNFNTTGGFQSGGSVMFSGDVNVQTSNPWRAVGGFRNTGTMNVTALPLNQTQLTNEGTIKVTGGPLTVSTPIAGLVNNGTLELRSGGHLYSSGQIVNNGTFRKVGTSDSEVQNNIAHSAGTLDANDGVLRLTGGGFYNAPVNIELGSTIRLEGPFVNLGHFFDSGARVGGAGVMEIQCSGSGAVEVLENTIFDLQGANGLHMQSGGVTIAANKELNCRGKLRWDGGNFEGPGQLYIGSNGSMLVPAGRVVSATDALVIDNAGTVTIDGVLSLNDDSIYKSYQGNTILRGEFRSSTPATSEVIVRDLLRVTPGSGNTARVYPRFFQSTNAKTLVESGTFRLLGGGFLSSESMETTQPGTLLSFDSGLFEVGSVLGGVFQVKSAAGSSVRIRGAGTVMSVLSGCALSLEGEGTIYLESNAQLGGPGEIINTANFIWNSQIGINGQALFRNRYSGTNSLQIPMGGARLRGTFENIGLVLQQGTLDMAASTVSNDGRWVLVPTTTSQIGITGVGGFFFNSISGRISAEAPPNAGRSAQISTSLDNRGTVQAIGGITLTINGQLVNLQNGVLEGGSWETADGGRIILPGIPPITKLKGANIVGSQQGMPWLAGVRDIEGARLYTEGDITFTGPLRIDDDDEFEVPSVMRIGPGDEVTVPGSTTVGSPQQNVISHIENWTVDSFQPDPPRLITPTLIVHGGIRPGGENEPGPFNLTGQLSMQPTGIVEIELGGLEPESEHDQMAITGSAALTGTLAIKLLPGFTPELGQSFTILTSTTPITGAFTAVQQPPGSVQLEAVYSPNAVTLTTVAGCYANCDGSTTTPALSANDFQCFLNAFASSTPYANCDGSTVTPTLNANDFQCFLNAYAAGCGR